MQPWTLLQLADSGFPTAGFAHSGDLAAAVERGRVRGADDLLAFVEESLRTNGTFALPFLRAARADPWSFAVLDGCCDASLPDLDANRASREQGQAFLRTVSSLSLDLERFAESARRSGTPGHLAPTFGAVLGLLGASDEDAARLFLFLGTRGILTAAVGLGVIGLLEAQALLARTAPTMSAVLAACAAADAADAAATTPAPGVDPRPPQQGGADLRS